MRILLIIMLFASVLLASESPDGSVAPADMVDKQLPALDKKIWVNLLQFYGSIRGIAVATLQDMQAVANFAWSAERQLQSIENASKRIDQIYTAIQNYRGDNPIDFVMFAELKVFRQADALKDYDIPSITESNEQLVKSRDEIANLGKDQAKAVADASVKTYQWFNDKFYYTQRRAQPDPRTVDRVCPRPGQMIASMSGAVVSENLAGADIRNQNLQTQAAMLAGMVGATGTNNGDVPTKVTVGVIRDNNRNNLLLSLQENDIQSAAIKNESWYLILKARQLDEGIVAKSLMVTCATQFADAVKKVPISTRFVDQQKQ
jgi:hypothetical protein